MTVEYSARALSNRTMSLRLLFLTLYEVCYGINIVDYSHSVQKTAASATIRTNIVDFFATNDLNHS